MISIQFAKTHIVAFAVASFLFFGIIGEGFAAGMPAQGFDPAMLVGTWAKDADKTNPELRVDYNENRSVFEFFQMRGKVWEKFGESKENNLQNVWLIKSEDGNFHLGIPAVQLGLRKVDK